MTILQSIFLGIVQGLTEFLPVSSSGHLAILQNLFHVETDGGMLFDILLHLGTLLVVFIVYRRDIGQMILAFFQMAADIFRNIHTAFLNARHKTNLPYQPVAASSYRKFVVLVLVSTIPTGIIGVLGKDIVEKSGQTLLIPGICLLITAVVLMIADTVPGGDKLPRTVTMRDALIIGIIQGFATMPGLSRSGLTIAICLVLGLDRRFAVKYSFILSIPAILGAAVLELKDVFQEPAAASQVGICLAGVAAAAVFGYICIRTMLVVVRQKKLSYFSYYCIVIGIIAIIGHFFF